MSNKRVDFTQLGGFPLTQDTLDFMQQSYRDAITGIAKLGGDAVILSGMTDSGTAVTDGWIMYAGELLFFQGGNKQTYFVIEDTTGQEQFEDDSVKTVYHTRKAHFGSGAGQIAFNVLKRLDAVLTMQTNLASLQTQVDALSGFVPQGLISMWGGSVAALPVGWALCDGQDGRPNLLGKFIVGYDPNDFDYNGIGRTGGEKEHQLSKGELPNVQLDVPIPVGDTAQTADGYGRLTTGAGNVDAAPGPTLKTEALGYGTPFENRPPYYTLAYIIKL